MSVATRRIGNEPIIVVTFTDPFNDEDAELGNQETARLIAEVNRPVYRIEDLTTLTIDFSTIVRGVGTVAQPNAAGTTRDPNARFIYVGQGEMVKMIVNSLAQEQYGGNKYPAFATLDEAISYARKTG